MESTNIPSVPTALSAPGELFSAAWKLFIANWQSLAIIAVLPQLIMLLSQLFAKTGIGIIVAIPLMLVGVILSIAMAPALIDVIHRVAGGEAVSSSVVDQYKVGFKYFWPFLLVCIMQSLIVMGSAVLLIIPGIIVSVYIYVSSFTMVVDGTRGFAVFTESYSLIRGRWWGVFGRMLFLALIAIGCSLIIGIVSVPVSLVAGRIGASVVNLLVYAFVMPFSLVYVYQLYISLKKTRQLGVVTSGFKKWLITSLVIGIFAMIILMVALPIAVISLVSSDASSRTWSSRTWSGQRSFQALFDRLNNGTSTNTRGSLPTSDTGVGPGGNVGTTTHSQPLNR